MKIADFLAEFNPDDFPPASPCGRWVGFEHYDPPFTLGQLRKMQKAGIIELVESERKYRLRPKVLGFKV